MPATRIPALLALLFTVVVWGVGPVFIRSLSVALGPADHLAIRYSIVAVLYLAGLAALGGWRIARLDWPRLLVIALIGMLGYNLGSAFGFAYVSAGIGGLVIGTQPLLIALLAALLGHERLTLPALAGLLVAFIGTVFLFKDDFADVHANLTMLTGALFIFLSGIAWAVYVVVSKPLVLKYGSYPITAWSIAIASVPMIAALASAETLDTVASMSFGLWLDMAFMVVLSTFVATITWNYGAAHLSAAAAGSSLYLVPILAVVSGNLFLAEPVTLDMVLGGLLILLGVAVAQFGPLLRRSHRVGSTLQA